MLGRCPHGQQWDHVVFAACRWGHTQLLYPLIPVISATPEPLGFAILIPKKIVLKVFKNFTHNFYCL